MERQLKEASTDELLDLLMWIELALLEKDQDHDT